MYIKLTDTKSGIHGEVLCDVCAQPIDLDEDCVSLTPHIGTGSECNIAHTTCISSPPARGGVDDDRLERQTGWWEPARGGVAPASGDEVVGAGRFDNAWSQVTKPRRILQSIAEQHRHPVMTEFLKQFNKPHR